MACYDILGSLGGIGGWSLGYAFSPPILLGVTAMLAEPTSFALVAAGLALALRSRHRTAGVVLALAVLAREPSLLVPLGLGLYALGRWDWKRGAAYLLPLALPIGWHVWIWMKLGVFPSAQSPTNFGVPFGGAYYRFGLLLGWHGPMLGEPVPTTNVLGGGGDHRGERGDRGDRPDEGPGAARRVRLAALAPGGAGTRNGAAGLG